MPIVGNDEVNKEIFDEICRLNDESTIGHFVLVTQVVNRANGWFDVPRPLSDDGALIASEAIEMFEEARSGHGPTETYFTHDKKCPVSPLVVATGHLPSIDCCTLKPEGFPTELADVLIRCFDSISRYGIDITFEIRRKLAYNLTRGYRHGGKLL